MGRLHFLDVARLVILSTAMCECLTLPFVTKAEQVGSDDWWSSVFAINYPKYFVCQRIVCHRANHSTLRQWDMIGGTLGPTGWIPPPQAQFFVSIIVDRPILPIINLFMGFLILAFEWPLSFIADTPIYRSYAVRYIWYAFMSFSNCECFDSVAISITELNVSPHSPSLPICR